MTQFDAPQPAGENDPPRPPVVVKKYANRRLYNTESSSYIALDNLADMVREGRDFVVYDARSGDDITRGVLTQIIVEEESKGRALLPTTFLRQLIGFYGDSLGGIVPRYLEHAMSAIARQQEQMRAAMHQTMGNLLPPGLDEMRRQNIAMMERAIGLFSPFNRPPGGEAVGADFSGQTPISAQAGPATPPSPGLTGPDLSRIEELQREVETLRLQLAERGVDVSASRPTSMTRVRRKPGKPD